jgi:hypothetical protein
MPCGLSDDELFILSILYKRRNLKSNSGHHCKNLERSYQKKYSLNFDDAIQNLLNKGYIAQIRKKEIKYYISDKKLMSFALNSHGYPVIRGKVRPL